MSLRGELMLNAKFLIVIVLFLLTSCSTSSVRLASKLERHVHCGMTIGEFESSTGLSVTENETPTDRNGTYHSRKKGGAIHVRLWVDEKTGIIKYQIIRIKFIKRVDVHHAREVCSGLDQDEWQGVDA